MRVGVVGAATSEVLSCSIGVYTWKWHWETGFKKLYAFFWVIPRRLNFVCQRFGTLCSIFTGMKKKLHTYPLMKMEHSVPKCWQTKFRRPGITQKKAYNIQNTAKVWNQEVKKIFDVSSPIFGLCLYVYHHHRTWEFCFSILGKSTLPTVWLNAPVSVVFSFYGTSEFRQQEWRICYQ